MTQSWLLFVVVSACVFCLECARRIREAAVRLDCSGNIVWISTGSSSPKPNRWFRLGRSVEVGWAGASGVRAGIGRRALWRL